MATFFDIEASGLRGSQNSVLSVSFSDLDDIYAYPTPKTIMGKWSEKNVWEPIQQNVQKAGLSLSSEKDLLSRTISHLYSLPEGSTLAGWNIGYDAVPQSMGPTGFDLPMLSTRAAQYGLQDELQEALKPLNIRDIGQEYAYKLANEIQPYSHLVDQGLLDADLFDQFEGYLKKADFISERGLSLSTLPEELAKTGVRIAGWKQELMAETMGLGDYAAHQSRADVIAGQSLMDMLDEGRPLFSSEEDVVKWGKKALQNKIVASYMSPSGQAGPDEHIAKLTKLMRDTEAKGHHLFKGFEESTMKMVRGAAEARGGTLQQAMKGKGIIEATSNIGALGHPIGKGLLAGGLDELGARASAFASKNPVGVGLLAIGGAMIAKNIFFGPSGNDDDYNVIEGLKHGGAAQDSRKRHSAFGSGWDFLRGLVKHGETFGEMVGSKGFQSALGRAKVVGEMAPGAFTQHAGQGVFKMQTEFRGKTVDFIRKQGTIGGYEVKAMQAFESEFAPTVYRHGMTNASEQQGFIDMEYFGGKEFSQVRDAAGARASAAQERLAAYSHEAVQPAWIEEEATQSAKYFTDTKNKLKNLTYAYEDLIGSRGWDHGDLTDHWRNAMEVQTSKGTQIGVIDWGSATPTSGGQAFNEKARKIAQGVKVPANPAAQEALTDPGGFNRAVSRKVSMQEGNQAASKKMWDNANAGRRHVSRNKTR